MIQRLRQRVGGRGVYAVLAAVLVVLAWVELLWTHSLEPLDNTVGDALLRWHARGRAPPTDIVLIDIDQASLNDPQMAEVAGPWAWPRTLHAELIGALAAQQPRAIVLDLILSPPDRLHPENDALLAQALAGYDRAFVPIILMPESTRKARLAEAPPAMAIRPQAHADAQAQYGIDGPTALPPEVWRTGYINFVKDSDGLGRWMELGRSVQGWWLPHMVGRVADAVGLPQPEGSRFRLHWYGADFVRVSYARYYLASQSQGLALPLDVRGKLVIIGATASGLLDFVPTPIDATTPGPFVLATALANLQQRDWLREAPDWLNPMLALGLIAALGWAFARRAPPMQVALAYALVAALIIGLSALALRGAIYWMPVSALVIGGVALLMFGLLSSRLEMAQRSQVEALFARFVDPRVARSLFDTARQAQPEVSASREISVLFSDIRGFTRLSEHRAPQDVVALLNAHFERQVAVVFAHQGTLDKFIGDAIMAFWGAPLDQPRHAELAVRAALGMAQALQNWIEELRQQGHPAPFDIGVGVHTGPAVVGFLGTAQRLEYTAIGDTVNLASRIEGCTKNVARVLVSDATRAQCADSFEFVDHGLFEVKGRDQPVRLFEPLHKRASASNGD
ncbi:MAG: adenylate/guanylate cyclase domain-containing protein [Rhodoferax sp.]